MATTPEIRPLPRVARELSASPAFLLARLGIGYKATVIAGAEEAGFELYDLLVELAAHNDPGCCPFEDAVPAD